MYQAAVLKGAGIDTLSPLVVEKLLTTFPAYTTWTFRTTAPESTFIAALVSLPPDHWKSTVIPPRTRAPLIDPVGHWLGSAGRRVTVKGVEILATSGAWRSAFYIRVVRSCKQGIIKPFYPP